MFEKILIANRGEIAVRVIKTCREMGIGTVAVYSEPDVSAPHVLNADEAVAIGPAEPAESYLNQDKIIAAARESGAEAIHPGYGFLSENPDFAERCAEEKIVFIGPPASAIRSMGNKTAAREVMKAAEVPLVPGMMEATTDPETLSQEAEKIGTPLMIKATAGGGGKGIRVLRDLNELRPACEAAVREAEKAFGDGAVYIEKFVENPRHVEIQVLADSSGNIVHLFERECSIQRRHQKIVEETPSTALTPETREKMGAAAIAAAKAAGYVNAGTVEFLLDPAGHFYFLEMNTRLQVEHPITEMTTGIDLVRQQIEIAVGESLKFKQENLFQRGHAIECRIYAEDPENNFFPAPGKILFCQEPTGPGIRNDSGIRSGQDVPVNYDPLLSKLVAYGESREAARRRMIQALKNYPVLGVKTAVSFLIEALESEPFQRGETYTDFLDRHFKDWKPNLKKDDLARMAFVIDESSGKKRTTGTVQSAGIPEPWETLGSWNV